MLVSIITVSYNSEKTIRDTIESVLNQTYQNIEYIIVDGMSSDHTMDIVKEYIEKFKAKGIDYKYISEKDQGIYDAMNKGIKIAKGKLVGIINSDDWYEKNAVACAVESYVESPYDLFYADLRIAGDKNDIIKKSKNGRIITSRTWNHPTTFITGEIYKKYQYKNENIHDDWDLILRIRKDGCRVCVVNKVLANFRRTGVSHEKSLKKAMDRAKIKYKIYRDNGYEWWYFIECYGMEIAKLIM